MILKEEEVLNTSYLTKVKKKKVLIQEYVTKIDNTPIPNQTPQILRYKTYYFGDNQRTLFIHHTLRFSNKHIQSEIGYALLHTANGKKRGKDIAVGIDNLHTIFTYNTFSKTIGFFMHWQKNETTIELARKALVYEKQTLCSIPIMQWSATLSRYIAFTNKRGFWYSLSLRKARNDISFIPQFDWEWYAKRWHALTLLFDVNGWYLFNSHPNPCYYSPKKTDSTMAGVRLDTPFFKGTLGFSCHQGYSFWDRVNLYSYGFSYKKEGKRKYSFECDFGNSSGRNLTTSYKSTECTFGVAAQW